MKRLCMIGAALFFLAGCAVGTDPGLSEGTEASQAQAAEEATEAAASAPTVSDEEAHTLSVELMTFQGGTSGAREYVVAQAKRACDSINKEVYIQQLTSQPTWRGGIAEVTFWCVEKDDPRLKQ